MLNVVANSRINITPCGFIVTESSVGFERVLIVEGKLTGQERAAIANILVDAVYSKQSAVLPKWDIGRVDRESAVIEFLRQREPKAERVRAGKDDFHSLHCVDIGKQRSRVDEVTHQSNLVNEHKPIPLIPKFVQILAHV